MIHGIAPAALLKMSPAANAGRLDILEVFVGLPVLKGSLLLQPLPLCQR